MLASQSWMRLGARILGAAAMRQSTADACSKPRSEIGDAVQELRHVSAGAGAGGQRYLFKPCRSRFRRLSPPANNAATIRCSSPSITPRPNAVTGLCCMVSSPLPVARGYSTSMRMTCAGPSGHGEASEWDGGMGIPPRFQHQLSVAVHFEATIRWRRVGWRQASLSLPKFPDATGWNVAGGRRE